jgi:hypothetical protein
MKLKRFHILLIFFSALAPIFIAAQNIGIGTPAPAMKLHISSAADTTLLLLDNTNTLAINTNSGIYFKNGSYFTGAIKAIGAGSVVARLSFFTYAAPGQNDLLERMSIADNGNVGIGWNTPEAKLDINGEIKIRGGGAGIGKVLTSDAGGLGSWQTPPATNSGFKAVVGSGGFNVASSTNTPIIFTSEEYDDPSAFFSTAFFAPADGLYHFDALVTWDIIGVAFNTQYVLVATLNGADKHGDIMQVPGGSGSRYRTQSLSFDLKMTAGQQAGLYVSQDSGMLQTMLGISGPVRYTFFSGRRIY